MSWHQTIIIGNLGRDPETNFLPSGDAVTNVSVAVTEKWRGKSGDMQESTEWYKCTAFRTTAENIAKYFGKGDQIMLIGRMKTRKWQDKDGSDRYSTELIVDSFKFIGTKRQRDEQQNSHNSQKSDGYQQADPDFDSDLPF